VGCEVVVPGNWVNGRASRGARGVKELRVWMVLSWDVRMIGGPRRRDMKLGREEVLHVELLSSRVKQRNHNS